MDLQPCLAHLDEAIEAAAALGIDATAAASVRDTSASDTIPSSIKTSTTPGSPFRRERAPSIC